MASKRKRDDGALIVAKRQRKNAPKQEKAIVSVDTTGKGQIIPGRQTRTSELHAPIMLLTGHQAEVYSIDFSPCGQYLASGSFDKSVFLWKIFGEECQNMGVLKKDGHKNAIVQVKWNHDSTAVVSGSADKTLALWDVETGKRKRKYIHDGFVNGVVMGPSETPQRFCSCSDDKFVRLWDTRSRKCIDYIEHDWPVTAVEWDKRHDKIFAGGIDNIIRGYDLRKLDKASIELAGHNDTITSLSIDPLGSFVSSDSMDNTLRIWDIRPFTTTNRCVKIFMGHQHNYEKILIKGGWSPDGRMVCCGSSDRHVYVWDTTTRQIKYKLPGHTGSVNEVIFHPTQPIIASCGSDKKIFLGEIADEYQPL